MSEITTLWSKIIDSWYLSISYIILWQTRSYWHWHIFWIEGRSRGQPSWFYYAMIVQQGKKFEIFLGNCPQWNISYWENHRIHGINGVKIIFRWNLTNIPRILTAIFPFQFSIKTSLGIGCKRFAIGGLL